MNSGVAPISIAVADLNGDGKPDIVVPNANGSIEVLLGNGDGTFRPVVTYTESAGILELTVGDVNGDSKPDIVASTCDLRSGSCVSNGEITILLGNGDGTFRSGNTYQSGGQFAGAVALADLNGDGKVDIVATAGNIEIGGSSGLIGVLLGNGDGTFQSPLDSTAGISPGNLVIADINGDGKPDVVCADVGNAFSGAFEVLLGNGDGTFQPPTRYGSGGPGPNSISIADVDHDGKPDLLVSNYAASATSPSQGAVSVYLGNGDGTFRVGNTYQSGGYLATSVVIADVDGDGIPDAVVSNG